MPEVRSRPPSSSHPEGNSPFVTSAVGLEETDGRLRAKRSSLFTQTVIWITGLICLAFMFGSLAQAWSNSQLMRQVQEEQQKTQQLQKYHDSLVQQANYYNDPFVIESEARQKLGYARPGEHVVVVISPPDQSRQRATPAPAAQEPQDFWQEWWKVFFGNG